MVYGPEPIDILWMTYICNYNKMTKCMHALFIKIWWELANSPHECTFGGARAKFPSYVHKQCRYQIKSWQVSGHKNWKRTKLIK